MPNAPIVTPGGWERYGDFGLFKASIPPRRKWGFHRQSFAQADLSRLAINIRLYSMPPLADG